MTEEESFKQRVDEVGSRIVQSLPEDKTPSRVLISALFLVIISIIRVSAKSEGSDVACGTITKLIKELYYELSMAELSYKQDDSPNE